MDATLGTSSAPSSSLMEDVSPLWQWFSGDGVIGSSQWTDRWLWIFLVPLFTGLLISVAVVAFTPRGGYKIAVSADARTSRDGVLEKDGDETADSAARLTFLGAAVVAAAQLEIFKTDTIASTEDLGILFVVNIVFSAVAASHNLLNGLPLTRMFGLPAAFGERLARGVLILSAVGSLASISVIVWRAPAAVTPGYVKIVFSLLLITAAIMVCGYVRARLPGKARTRAKAHDPTEEMPVSVAHRNRADAAVPSDLFD